MREAGLPDPGFSMDGFFTVTHYSPIDFEKWLNAWTLHLSAPQVKVLQAEHDNGNVTKLELADVIGQEWIDLDDVEAPENDLRLRAYERGAARFANTEGIWYGNNELFFACTAGGENSKGQIFRYIPSKYEGTAAEKKHPGKIELFLEPNNLDIFENCDNLTIAPWGDVIICEDKSDPRIMGITPDGVIYPIAKNVGFRKSEFAGPVFSPSGKTMFVNIQSPGLTLAITGPWKPSYISK